MCRATLTGPSIPSTWRRRGTAARHGTVHECTDAFHERSRPGIPHMAVEFRTLPLRAVVKPAIVRPPVARAGGALGEVLLERQLITREQLTLAVEHQRSSPERRLGQVLLDLGFTTPDAVLGALSVQLGVPATRLNGFTVSHTAVQALPEKVARKH